MREKTADAARGRWREILPRLGVSDKFLGGKRNGPCPMCGGKTRFMFSDRYKSGDYICTQCGAGQGIKLVMKVNGWDFKTACRAIDDVIGNNREFKMDKAHQAARKFFDSQPDFVPGISRYTAAEVLQDESISFDTAMGVVSDMHMRRGKLGEPPKSTRDATLWLKKFHPEKLDVWLDEHGPEVRWWLERQGK